MSVRKYRAPAPKPRCASGKTWLRNRLGRDALAPLTGQDMRALEAYLHLLELYFASDEIGERCAYVAIGCAIAAAQPSVWHVFRAAIPWAREWDDEARLWPAFEAAAREVIAPPPENAGDARNQLSLPELAASPGVHS